MSVPRLGISRRLLAVVLTLTIGGAVVSAQTVKSVPETLVQIVDMLTSLQASISGNAGGLAASVAALQTAVSGIQTDVSSLKTGVSNLQQSLDALTPASQSNVRVTAPVFFRSGVMDCVVTNVATEARNVRIELVNGGTGNVIASDPGTLALLPNHVRSTGLLSGVLNGVGFCRFTVLNGSRTDIRGNLTIGATLADDTTKEAVPAE